MSSLLLLTVALNIQEANFGVFAGLAAQFMIVVSLWWWSDLDEELDDAPLSRAFRAWRLPTSLAAAGGVAGRGGSPREAATAPSLTVIANSCTFFVFSYFNSCSAKLSNGGRRGRLRP